MNIQNNIASINTYQTQLNTSAHNIANINTGSRNTQTDLAKELVNQITIEDATEVNVSAIKTQDEMLGSLLDIKA